MTTTDFHEPQYLSKGQHDETVALSAYVGPTVAWPQSMRTRAQITIIGPGKPIITLGWRQMAQLQQWLGEVLASHWLPEGPAQPQ